MSQEQTTQDVARLTNDWVAAELRSDIPFLERTLADDFIGVGPLGFMLTKEQWIARLQSGDLRYDALAMDEVQVRAYDRAAIVIGRQEQDAIYRDTKITAKLRTTLVFIQRDGAWHLAGLQLSPIGQPPTFAKAPAG